MTFNVFYYNRHLTHPRGFVLLISVNLTLALHHAVTPDGMTNAALLAIFTSRP